MKSWIIFGTMLIFAISFGGKSTAQEWKWKWGENAGSGHGENVSLFMNSCDFRNNYYGQILYQDKIYFQDTALIHGYGTYNTVFLKYDSTGKLYPPLDFWTLITQQFYNPWIVPDKDLNLYIGGTYAEGFQVQDTSFLPGPGVSNFHSEIFLLKVRNDYDIVWGKIISGTWQDDLTGLIPAENGDLILSTHHICSSQLPTIVNFFNQDTIISATKPFSSIMKVNLDGIIQWRKEIQGDIHQLQLTEGKNGLIYYTGYSGDDIIIGADTLNYPWGPDYMFANFIISFNQDGELMESMYLNPHLRFYYFQVDELGNKYFSESFQDTLVLGQDTILGPANPSWIYVAKLNPSVDEAIWYHIIPKQAGQTIWSLQLMLHQNRVLFSTTANKALLIGNANLWLGVYTKGVFGEFQENGEVSNISLLSAEFNLHKFHSITDNCGNIIAGGDFLYKSIIANDTIFSYSSIITDAYIAKLQTDAPLFFDLGNDTTVCESYTLVGPAGYTTYIWNDSITTQNWWTVSETGGYVLQCADSQGCWAHDSIFVTVHAGIEVTMPGDTLVCINDSLSFSVDGSFESYLWSTGDTTNAIAFPATDLGAGSHWISLEITDVPCYFIDSLLVTINPAIEAVLPSDTLVCSNEMLSISVPDGYEHYQWSTGDTTNSISIVAGSLGSGQQQLEISIQDGPCWFIDSVTVIIHPEIIAELPSDTSIKLHDSIVFSVPDTFEHYLWSTGDTTHTIQVEGMSVGIGSHLISIEIWDGPCYFNDTLHLTVQDDFGIDDQSGDYIEIIPNPSHDNISISSPIPLHFIEILDLGGKIVYSEELNKKVPNHYFFNLSGIGKGVYLIRIHSADSMITRKMIKF